MAPLAPPDQNRLVEAVRQSPPVDLTKPYDASTLRGKTILVTGGSSGLGAAFARRWASHGANLVIGDINDAAGEALVAELRTTSPGSSSSSGDNDDDGGGGSDGHGHHHHRHHFVHVDVTDWSSQASLFQEAVRLSPTGVLDAVVASAGISDSHGAATGLGFENPAGLDRPDPPPPSLKCIEVNLIGMLYTAHLALFWLQQDGNKAAGVKDGAGYDSGDGDGDGDGDGRRKRKRERDRERDRHFLMVGSYAGLAPIPGVPEYVTSKHGVTGLFRSLRTLSYRQGIRVNLLCPYFVDTPILGNRAMALLAGMGLTRLDDVVDAATRFVADGEPRISGRALAVGPRMSLLRDVLPVREVGGTEGEEEEEEEVVTARDGDVLVDEDVARGKGQAVWECYAHDYDTVDFFIRRYIRVLNTVAAVKGWVAFPGGNGEALASHPPTAED
ncbi:5'-hydroxyaverantin dehydrogenase [Cytospora mali]|uniref:5'-hydroxyaverantin dehydrogenase n=1 Tax=Cytospora mali TaxID=578113 RepID=A0A194UWK5_CYTMA|nr:5'-hydroxyaverantin dehydrogenase [Valsa mali var. pyri (nom. inval.)]